MLTDDKSPIQSDRQSDANPHLTDVLRQGAYLRWRRGQSLFRRRAKEEAGIRRTQHSVSEYQLVPGAIRCQGEDRSMPQTAPFARDLFYLEAFNSECNLT